MNPIPDRLPLAPENTTRDWLAFQAKVHIEYNKAPWSPARWLLDHGTAFQYGPLPKGVRRRPPKRCYWNALELAQRKSGRYVYCEGYASHIIPTNHAWCYDRETGLVVDPTWESGLGYIGLPIKSAYAVQRLSEGFASLWDWENGFPIMTGEVAPEIWRENISYEKIFNAGS